MAEAHPVLDFFGEDSGHEFFFRAITARLAREVGLRALELRTRSNRGGHGRAISELKAWLKSGLQERGQILVVLIDANAQGWSRQRKGVEDAVPPGSYPHVVIGCPDPEVEAWLTADPGALARALGAELPVAGKSGTEDPKKALERSLERAGVPILGDPMSIAYEVVPEMDLHKAGKVSSSLRHFLEELRGALLQVHPG